MERSTTITDLLSLAWKVGYLYTRRVCAAQQSFLDHNQDAAAKLAAAGPPSNPWQAWAAYGCDWVQRWVLFWDTLRQRGNNFVEHERAGKPPLLVFDYETVVDGRKFPRPVNSRWSVSSRRPE